MIKITSKSQYLQLIFGIIFIFLILPVKQGWAGSIATLKQEVRMLKVEVSKIREDVNKLLLQSENQGNSQGIVEVIVEDTPPLAIPPEFKAAVEKLKGKFLIVGDSKTVRLLSLDGDYFNPCFSESSGTVDASVFNEATHTCKFSARLSDVIMLLAQKFGDNGGGHGDCGTCTGENATQVCKKSTDRYGNGCSGGSKSCDNNC